MNKSGWAILGNYLLIIGVIIIVIICNDSYAAIQEPYCLPVPTSMQLSAVFSTPRPKGLHAALDIVADRYALVCAAMPGEVVECFYSRADNKSKSRLGNYVVIQLENGHTQLYAHLQVHNVLPGQLIEKGQMIGQVGSTGASSGCHLHFAEFDEKGIPVKTTFKFGITWKLIGNVYAYQIGQ